MNVRLEWQYKKKEATFGLYRPAEASIDKFVVCSFQSKLVNALAVRLLLIVLTTNHKLQTIFSCAGFF